jgi:A/G-specific adenine glycosylase
MKSEFSKRLRAWYEEYKRDLRWRHTRDPYHIWLSETILQQTRVQQGAAYYDRFLEKCVKARIVSVAFEVQKADHIPVSSWDKAMEKTYTETNTYKTN